MSGIAIKRCTLVVQDLRRAVAFYRDVLGLAQVHDSCITMNGKIVPAGLPGAHAHIAVMDAGAVELGLLQWTDPPLAKPDDPYPIHLGIGDCAFTIETAALAPLRERLVHAHEARLHDSAGADDVGFFDLDGFFFALRAAASASPHLARTTLIVRDAAVSLSFYRVVLGMTLVSDTTAPLADALLPAGGPGALTRRLVLDAGGTALELMCCVDPPLDASARPRHHIGIGDAILVAQTDDLDALQSRMKHSAGRLHAGLSAGSGADIEETVSLFDPDGHFFAFTR